MKPQPIFATVVLVLASVLACGQTTGGSSTSRWAACSHNSECTLAASTCCGVCGTPTVEDMDGVNEASLDEHYRSVCPKPVPCPLCVLGKNPNLLATCAQSTCTALDIRRDPASACTTDDDCRLRVTGCCECGGSTTPADLIAINASHEQLYTALVCDPATSCPACAPLYPNDVQAYCASDGHCQVRPATPPNCLLPFDPGPCDAAMRVYAFVAGACVEQTYGGCQGNDNRFATIEECLATCAGQPDPNDCPDGRVRRTACLSCGPAGGCGTSMDVCAKSCQTNADCEPPLGYCASGACEAGGCD